jgi:hypothetical protein
MKAVIAVVAVLILADVAFAGTLIAQRATSPAALAQVAQKAATHPCNHGFYVSQAAHAKKHGHGNSDIARSKLGKDGNCSTKLPGS